MPGYISWLLWICPVISLDFYKSRCISLSYLIVAAVLCLYILRDLYRELFLGRHKIMTKNNKPPETQCYTAHCALNNALHQYSNHHCLTTLLLWIVAKFCILYSLNKGKLTKNLAKYFGIIPVCEGIVCKFLTGIVQSTTDPKESNSGVYAKTWNFPLTKKHLKSYRDILWWERTQRTL